jgi:hypothetical protein
MGKREIQVEEKLEVGRGKINLIFQYVEFEVNMRCLG